MNTSAKIETARELTTRELADFIRDEIALLLDRKGRNCLNCEHFVNDSQECSLVGKMPPPKIAVRGCEKFLELIPF